MGCVCVNKMLGFLTLLCLIWSLINAFDDNRVHVCSSTQYMELGSTGTINCDFSRYTYSGIFWYNSTERFGHRPLLSFKNSEKDGMGYDSREFDIHANGSLIIKNVTLQHDHSFSVAFIREPDDNTLYDDVVVIVTVKPSQDHPIFEECNPSQLVCLRRLNKPFHLACYVKDVRPAANLEMVISTIFGDERLDYQNLDTETKGAFFSRVSVNLTSVQDRIYFVFGCIDNSNHTLLTSVKSFLLVQGNDFPQPSQLNPVPRIVQTGTELQLYCTDIDTLYISWTKIVYNGSVISLAFSLSAADWHYIPDDRYTIREDNVFILGKVTQDDEGVYVCVFGDGTAESTQAYNVTVHEGADKATTFENRVEHGNAVRKIWGITIGVIVFSFVVIGILFVGKLYPRNQRKSNGGTGEEVSLTQSQLSKEKDKFRDLLKDYYKKSHRRVQPIPYQHNKWYSITECFVETGIEYMRRGLQGLETWEKVEVYHEILKAEHSSTKRAIIEGEPGYGKSTLCVQLTKDWCDPNPLSPLVNVDILILIRSRRLNGNVKTFYDAIKELFLSPDSKLSEKVLREILAHYSAVVLLDGFDNYPGRSNLAYAQIEEIMNCNMLNNCLVVLTTRSSCVKREFSTDAERYRLLGFDRNARSEYIKKIITHSSSEANEIEKIITTHPFLADLCQVPLFFVLFAHMVNKHRFGTESQIQSVTSIFQNIMKCIYHHMQYKDEGNVFENASFEYNHTKLDKLAFEGLKAGQISWERGEMYRYLGETDYDRYCSSGILVEDEAPMGTLQTITKVRFYHKLFCEWYASHHLSQIASQRSYDELETQLQKMDPTDLQYVYRIACGLSEKAAAMIIRYIRNVRDGQQFEILCILEQPGKEDHFTETVTNLCSGRVNIDSHDSRLLQRSTVQLLTIAASHKIAIKDLRLTNMNCVAHSSKKSLKIRQDLCLPSLETLQQLTIVDTDRQISLKDFEDILEYASLCNSLKDVRIEKCLLPLVMETTRIQRLKSKHIQVLWLLPYSLSTWYRLNTTQGTWQHEQKTLSETEYAKVKQDFDRLKAY